MATLCAWTATTSAVCLSFGLLVKNVYVGYCDVEYLLHSTSDFSAVSTWVHFESVLVKVSSEIRSFLSNAEFA